MEENKPTSTNGNNNHINSSFTFAGMTVDSNSNNAKIKDHKINLTKPDSDLNVRREYHNSHVHLSNGKTVIKPNETDRSKRKKFKEPGVINEYPASAIPNNIGDKSIEKLTDYVNGICSKDPGKSVKSEKKIKNVIGNKKNDSVRTASIVNHEKISDAAIPESVTSKRIDEDCEELIGTVFKVESKSIETCRDSSTNNQSDEFDFNKTETVKELGDHPSYISDNNDEDFYQVVRYKTRNKSRMLKQKNCPSVEKHNKQRSYETINFVNSRRDNNNLNNPCNEVLMKVSKHNLVSKDKTLNVNDKQNLNCFIYHLWIEFQNKHDKYLREQNDQIIQLPTN